MPRRLRQATGGLAYHVLNRAVGRARLFHKEADYAAFARVLEEAWLRLPTRLLCYCVMPNHWHLVLCVLPAGVRNRRTNGPGYGGGNASKCCRSSRSS